MLGIPVCYIGVRGPVLPSQLQYPSKTVEVKVVESLRLLFVQYLGPRLVQQRLQDDRRVNLQCGVGVETLATPDCASQTAEGLAGFGDLAGHFIVNLGGAEEGAAG
ncbi:hypothetical protein SprV_0702267400 [Sparganum proliferum]